ncbi:carbohydrate-binding module family 13 protein [Pleurotus ostreatus PC15]|uniref:Carbohydrate-binding module family 13 protein n=1 Tax=Pleurotus ostreatus (strain PC15) TaxID=1137138 RepID=A0A067P6L0_PLEO1|nr:carbohydrate-binding module family 13 protein [Pleurotus ostreatus PC15]
MQFPSTFLALALAALPPALAAPAQINFRISPSVDTSKCLDVRGDLQANGTAVDVFDCNATAAQNWIIRPGTTKVQLAGTNFCLDAGSSPANGVGMKIWECFDNLPAQQWFLTADDRIALENQGLCLDLTNGNVTNGNQVQTWQCTDNDINQAWLLQV